MSDLPAEGTHLHVHTREARGFGVVTDVCERWNYVRVTLSTGLRCSVHPGEWEVVTEPERTRDAGRPAYKAVRRGRMEA